MSIAIQLYKMREKSFRIRFSCSYPYTSTFHHHQFKSSPHVLNTMSRCIDDVKHGL